MPRKKSDPAEPGNAFAGLDTARKAITKSSSVNAFADMSKVAPLSMPLQGITQHSSPSAVSNVFADIAKYRNPPSDGLGITQLTTPASLTNAFAELDGIKKTLKDVTGLGAIDNAFAQITKLKDIIPDTSAISRLADASPVPNEFARLKELQDKLAGLSTIKTITSSVNAFAGLPAGGIRNTITPDPAPASPQPETRKERTLNSAADLGEIVHMRRKAMGLTQQQFADITGVGRRFISELEAGKPTLEIGRVLKVCHAAGIDLMAISR